MGVTIHSAQDLGALIRAQRKKRGWTQKELAAQVGVRPLWISQFERGKSTAQIGLVFRTLKALELYLSASDPKLATGGQTALVDLDEIVESNVNRVAE